jgi:hypothetical protein
MPRATRQSKPLDKAERRATSLQAVNPKFDLGNGRSLSAYTTAIQDLRIKLSTYNAMIANIDQAQRAIELAEEQLNDFSEHLLLGVAAIYGKGSDEYAMAGGSRKRSSSRSPRQSSASLSQPSTAPTLSAPSLSTNGATGSYS